jgi:acetyl-CoA carboxylase carboxyltransferase component
MHSEISGTVDFKEPNDHLCLARLRSLVSKLGHPARAPFDRAPYDAAHDAPKYPASDLYTLLDPDPARSSTNTYDTHELIARLVDRSEFDEYKPDWASLRIRSSISRTPATPARSASSSAASSMPRARTRPRDSSWTATRT